MPQSFCTRGVSSDNDLSDLMENNKPLSELICNNLLRVIKLAVKPIEDKIDIDNAKLVQMEVDITENNTSIAQLKDNCLSIYINRIRMFVCLSVGYTLLIKPNSIHMLYMGRSGIYRGRFLSKH